MQGLQDCKDTFIGNASIKGISGGEKRRTSVGMELVTSPNVLFLDEPTSGLDSSIAVQIMRTLKSIAEAGRTVALTIHQPNSDITELFDDFILMAKGRIMYAGVASFLLLPVPPFFDVLSSVPPPLMALESAPAEEKEKRGQPSEINTQGGT